MRGGFRRKGAGRDRVGCENVGGEGIREMGVGCKRVRGLGVGEQGGGGREEERGGRGRE